MSKERELLRRISSHSGSVIPSHFIYEIQELLAQPEQTEQPEQEPVAWKDKIYGNLHHVNWGDSIPLYTLPPKREPLTATQIDKIFNSQLKEYGQLCDKSDFELFTSSIEKAHGIGR